jgi:putative ABC transport system permease protein
MALLTLAWRNLWRNARRTWITVFSVVFAVLLALFLQSMDYGSQEMMVKNVVRFSTGYVQLQDTLYQEEPNPDNAMYFDEEMQADLLNAHPEIAYLVPRFEGFVLAAGELRTRVSMVVGIDAEAENRFNEIGTRLISGQFIKANAPEVVMGSGLAKSLELQPEDTIVLFGQGFQGAMAAGKYVVSGLIQHPVPDLNERIILLPLSQAQELFNAPDYLTSLIVTPHRTNRHKALAQKINQQLPEATLQAYPWETLQPELVQTIAFDRAGSLIFLLILYIVIAFGIFGTVLTMTLEREKEFGMLISLGMRRQKLALVIFLETFIINFLGVLLGMLLALPILLYFYFNPISLGEGLEDLMAEYGMEAILPFSLDPQIFIQQGVVVFFISMLIVMYPIIRIFTLKVLDAARK